MKSTEKVMLFLDQAMQMNDAELAEAVPVPMPPYAVRGLLATFAGQLPEEPDELDGFLDGVVEFCSNLKSDREPAEA